MRNIGGPKAQRGLTLLELMLALALLGLLAAAAGPPLQALRQRHELRQAQGALQMALLQLRSEALRRQALVRLCVADARGGCAAQGDWTQGWLLWADTDGDGQPGRAEPLLAQQAAWPAALRLRGNATVARGLRAGADGLIGPAGTLTVCHLDLQEGQQLVISIAGRLRLQAAAAADCQR